MPNLMNEHDQARKWAELIVEKKRGKGIFGTFRTGVAWTEEGNPLDGQNIDLDPLILVSQINKYEQPLLLDHDPGKPKGKVIAAELFQTADGRKFLGVVLGLYDGAQFPGFADFPFDLSADPGAPNELPELSTGDWIEIAADTRDVDAAWISEAAEGAPLPFKSRPLSHNAAGAAAELIRVTLPYLALVWNPFVTKIASKAGEDAYEAMRKWMDRLIRRMAERKNPIMVLQAPLDDCDVSFIVRGSNVDTLRAAAGSLEAAASHAHHLIQVLRQQNAPLRTLFYEFEIEHKRWSPSYGELQDGRLITDNRALILAEKLPQGLSLGLGGFVDED